MPEKSEFGISGRRPPTVKCGYIFISFVFVKKKDDLEGMWDEKPNVPCISAEICDATGGRILKGGEGETVLDCLLPFTAKG